MKFFFVILFLYTCNAESAVKLYPVSYQDRWIISLGVVETNQSLKKSILAEGKKRESFLINAKLKDQVFAELNFPRGHKFFYFVFGKNQIKELDLLKVKELYVQFNEAAESISTIGIVIPSEGSSDEKELLTGLAAVAKDNPFKLSDLSEIKWQKDSKGTLKGKIVDIKEYEKDTGQKNIKVENEILQSANVKEIEIYSGTVDLKYPDAGYAAKAYRIEIRKNGKVLKEIKGTGDYSNAPKHIWIGQIFENSTAIIFSEMGMGQCGQVFYIESDKLIEAPSLPCGDWGC